MRTTARNDHTRGRRAGLGAHSAGVHHLATSNGDIDWEFLESRWRKGQRIITEHDDVSELPHLDVPEQLFLEARVGSVDGLATQGFRHGERLTCRNLLAAKGLMRHCRTEVA